MHHAALLVKLLAASAATASGTLSTCSRCPLAFTIVMECGLRRARSRGIPRPSVVQAISNDRNGRCGPTGVRCRSGRFDGRTVQGNSQGSHACGRQKIRQAAHRGQERDVVGARSQRSSPGRTSSRTIPLRGSRWRMPTLLETWAASFEARGLEMMSSSRRPVLQTQTMVANDIRAMPKRLIEERPNHHSAEQKKPPPSTPARRALPMRARRGTRRLASSNSTREQSLTAREQAIKGRERQVRTKPGRSRTA